MKKAIIFLFMLLVFLAFFVGMVLTCGCTHWEYRRHTVDANGVTETVHAGRSTLFMWGQADYVKVVSGDKSLTMTDLELDPEEIKVVTPHGAIESE